MSNTPELTEEQKLQHSPVLTGVSANLDVLIDQLRDLNHPAYDKPLDRLNEAREALNQVRGLQ